MIPYLAAYRTDPNAAIRMSLAKSLGRFQDPSTLPVLESMLQDEDPVVRREVFDALTRTPGERSAELFRIGLADPDPQVRDAACAALLNYLPETAVPLVYEFLKDGNAGVRETAGRTLAVIKTQASSGFELILTGDHPLEMKHWALVNLMGNYGIAAVVDRLAQICPDKFRDRLNKIVHGEYELGMGKDDLYLSLGKPSRTRSTGGEAEEWDYDDLGKIFKFQAGTLAAVDDLD